MSSAAISRIWFSIRYSLRVLPGPASKIKMPFWSCSTALFPCPTSRMASLGESVIGIRIRRKFEIAEKEIFPSLCADIHQGEEQLSLSSAITEGSLNQIQRKRHFEFRVPARDQGIHHRECRIGVPALDQYGGPPRPPLHWHLAVSNLPCTGSEAPPYGLGIVKILRRHQNWHPPSMQTDSCVGVLLFPGRHEKGSRSAPVVKLCNGSRTTELGKALRSQTVVNDRKRRVAFDFVRQFSYRLKGAAVWPPHDIRFIPRLAQLKTPAILIDFVVVYDSHGLGRDYRGAHFDTSNIGSSTVNSAPPSFPLGRTFTVPPSSVTASFTIVNPRPVPPGVVVYPGSKISEGDSPSMPGPLSKTLSERRRPSFSARTTICRSTGGAFS